MQDHTFDLSVIVPAHNEGAVIERSLAEIDAELAKLGIRHGIIVVDDGSTDGTYAKALKACEGREHMRVVRTEKNNGKGHAIKYGVQFAHGTYVTFIDADMDLHPRQIPRFMQIMAEHQADVVVGSKLHPESKIIYPRNRRILSSLYHVLNNLLFDLPVQDTQAGLKLFRRRVLEEVMPKVRVKRYAFDLELLVNAHKRGFKIIEAPVDLNYQRMTPRINLRDVARIFTDTCAIYYRLKIARSYD